LTRCSKSLLSASAREEVQHYESVHGKGNLNFFRYLFGGVEAGYDKIRHLLKNVGLSEDNIKTLVSTIADMADRIAQSINTGNDYSVAGELKISTIQGKVISGKNMIQYRVLANKGTAGSDGATAPANVEAIPLN